MKATVRRWIYPAATVLLAAYVVFAVSASRKADRSLPFTSVAIEVVDSAHTGFVTAADVDRMLGGLRQRVKMTPRGRLNLLVLERQLEAQPAIESARCYALNNGELCLRVVSMQPVVRVFDGAGSYYVNAGGKTIPADAGNHVDVPVVSGHFKSGAAVTALLPMFRYIHANPGYDALVTSVTVDRRGDIIVIPAIRGHVINLGDTSQIADKFTRLSTFYHRVMPVKGWQFYDTLSVKWRGRLVATRAGKRTVDSLAIRDAEAPVEIPDDGTMMTDDRIDAVIAAQAVDAAHSARSGGNTAPAPAKPASPAKKQQ